MSHEIKPIYTGALCEKYGNNIASASKTALCIWNMWSGVRSFSGVFAGRDAVNTNGPEKTRTLISIKLNHMFMRHRLYLINNLKSNFHAIHIKLLVLWYNLNKFSRCPIWQRGVKNSIWQGVRRSGRATVNRITHSGRRGIYIPYVSGRLYVRIILLSGDYISVEGVQVLWPDHYFKTHYFLGPNAAVCSRSAHPKSINFITCTSCFQTCTHPNTRTLFLPNSKRPLWKRCWRNSNNNNWTWSIRGIRTGTLRAMGIAARRLITGYRNIPHHRPLKRVFLTPLYHKLKSQVRN